MRTALDCKSPGGTGAGTLSVWQQRTKLRDIENLPIYLISGDQPWTISEDDLIDNVPLTDLLMRLDPGEHLYLLDHASIPGQTKLICLA